MVKVTFKLTDTGTVELDLDQPLVLEQVLKLCADKAGLEIGGVIAVRQGRVITLNDLIGINDSVDIFPAISGG